MVLVDRKVSLPNDFDIKIAYIYPVIIDSVGQDLLNEEVMDIYINNYCLLRL